MLQKKKNFIQFDIVITLLLLFLPYAGEEGYQLFRTLGKYYYAAVFLASFLDVILQRIFIDKSVKSNVSGYLTYFIFALVMAVIVSIMLFATNLTFDDYALMMILLIYPVLLSFNGITDRTFIAIGNASVLMWVFMIFYSLENPQNFNPNTYSFILIMLFAFSMFSVTTIRYKLIQLVIVVLMFMCSMYCVDVIYDSHTQELGLMLLFVAFFLKILHKVKPLSKIALSLFFIVSVLMPIIAVILINKGIVGIDIITWRGERWIKAYESMMQVDIFNCAPLDPGSHNGFFHMAVNYSIFTASIFVVGFLYVLLSMRNKMQEDKYSYVLLNIICYYFLINWVESFYISVQDASFTAIIVALLVAKTKSKEKYTTLEE